MTMLLLLTSPPRTLASRWGRERGRSIPFADVMARPPNVCSWGRSGHHAAVSQLPLLTDAVEKVCNKSGVARAGVFQRQVLSLRFAVPVPGLRHWGLAIDT